MVCCKNKYHWIAGLAFLIGAIALYWPAEIYATLHSFWFRTFPSEDKIPMYVRLFTPLTTILAAFVAYRVATMTDRREKKFREENFALKRTAFVASIRHELIIARAHLKAISIHVRSLKNDLASKETSSAVFYCREILEIKFQQQVLNSSVETLGSLDKELINKIFEIKYSINYIDTIITNLKEEVSHLLKSEDGVQHLSKSINTLESLVNQSTDSITNLIKSIVAKYDLTPLDGIK